MSVVDVSADSRSWRRNRGALGARAPPPPVFAKVNAHYTRVVEERPLYKQPCLVHHRQNGLSRQLCSICFVEPLPVVSMTLTMTLSLSQKRRTIEPTAILNRCRPPPLISNASCRVSTEQAAANTQTSQCSSECCALLNLAIG